MPRKKFTIGVATPMGIGVPYAYFAPAIALDYDRDEDLEFAFYPGGEPAGTARNLCAGACDIACLNTIVGFLGRANEGLPMFAVGSKARRAHRYFAVTPDSPIRTLADLRGKTIACDFPHIQPLAEAALAQEGVTPGSFEWITWQGSGMEFGGMVDSVCQGNVDALFIMDWTDGDATARGFPLRHLRSKLLEHIRVSSCYWTTDDSFERKRDAHARALRAIQKSLIFSFANPEAALRMMWDVAPQTKPHTKGIAHDIEVLKACLEPMRIDETDPDPRWCAIPAEEMTAWHEFLLHSKSIRRALDLDALYTTALVERINDFDPKEVRKSAATVS